MKNRSKMILGLASLLGVTAGATAVSGFAWFVTTKTADVEVTNIGVYSKNPTLSVNIKELKGLVRTNNANNDFDLETDTTNEAGLTDISSSDGIHFFDPEWQAASEGLKATKFNAAEEGVQYLSFDLEFVKPNEGSLYIFLDRPSIKAKVSNDEEDKEAAAVARVAFSKKATAQSELENVLTLGNQTGDGYNKGLKPGVGAYGQGDYTILNEVQDCENLYAPSETNYSALSTGVMSPENMFITQVTSTANVTVHVTIWLEGTSHVTAATGDNSKPIGGQIEVKLPIVAFTTATAANP